MASTSSLILPGTLLRSISHLLLSGSNPLSPPLAYAARSLQQPSNPTPTPIPFASWIGSIGRAKDVEEGWEFLRGGISSGLEHTILGYRSAGVDRVFSVGRNEVGQLGIGFNSQEGTRGLLEGFTGEEILQVGTGCQSSFLLVRKGGDAEASSSLYSTGSLQRGRLGLPSVYAPNEIEDPDEDPELHMLSQATEVDSIEGMKGNMKSIEIGFEHTLVLTDQNEIYGTGCNTDSQLGLGPTSSSLSKDVYSFLPTLLPTIVKERGIEWIRAGADTSALLDKEGDLWTWGNSEYAQALHSRIIPQIHEPTLIDSSFLSLSRKIVDFRCGGSFSLILDDKNSVYSAGYGALGHGPDTLSSEVVQKIEALEGERITRIRAGWGWAIAIRDAGKDSAIFTWGLNNIHGRLGHPSPSPSLPVPPTHIHTPTQIALPTHQLGFVNFTSEGEWELGEVEGGVEALWIEVKEMGVTDLEWDGRIVDE